MKKIVFAVSVVLAIGFIVTSCKCEQKETEKTVTETKEVIENGDPEIMTVATYQCPMDCEKGKTYNKPGQCPVCKMDLKKQESNSSL